MKTTLVYLVIGAVMFLGLWRISNNPPVEAKPAAVVMIDHTFCRAKLANWVMRHEELAKPEKDMWESFYAYMGPECMK